MSERASEQAKIRTNEKMKKEKTKKKKERMFVFL